MALALFGAGAGDPVLIVDSSTISGNDGSTPGIVLQSTGDADLEAGIVNSTVSGNTGTHGGVYADLSGTGAFVIDIAHSTITDNTAAGGSGGVTVIDGALAVIQHSIVGGNDGTDFFSDPASSYEIDWTLVSDTSGSAEAATAVGAGTGNIVGAPELGPLALNGGTTRTHLPIAGSPVIDAGLPGIATAPASDQRGSARIQNARIDLGAVEAAPLLPATGSTPPLWLVFVAVGLLIAGVVVVVIRRWRVARR
jgi:LPXTG-motif cell wall-anchored protein